MTLIKSHKAMIIFTVAVAALAVSYLVSENNAGGVGMEKLAEDVKDCNEAPIDIRFSCYRAAIENNQYAVFEKYAGDIKNNKNINFKADNLSYAIFGTNCHSFYHAFGDFIATNAPEKDLSSKIEYCSNACTNGCVMGLYKRFALDNGFDNEVLASFYGHCPEDSKHQCTHEVGHLLHDKYVTSVLGVLDGVTEKNYSLKANQNSKYTTYQTPNLDVPFEDCKKLVPEHELPYCYTGIGHNLFLFSEFSPGGHKDMFAECAKTDPANTTNCYDFLIYRIGINEAAPQFLSGNSEKGRQICQEVVGLAERPDLLSKCHLGIGGGIGLFMDSEYVNVNITSENLSSLQQEVWARMKLCEESGEDMKVPCYKGLLGTGAKKLYKTLNLNQSIIEELWPIIDDGFEVVG